MIEKSAIAILWAALLTGGAVHIWRQAKDPASAPPPSGGCLPQSAKTRLPHWTAVRDLAENWLVRNEDLRDPGGGNTAPAASAFVGKYVVCKAAAGETLVEADLAPGYRVTVVAGKQLFSLQLSPQDPSTLNAGSRVSVLDGSEIVHNVEVAALDCSASCRAVLQVSQAESDLLTLKKGATLQIVPRKAGE